MKIIKYIKKDINFVGVYSGDTDDFDDTDDTEEGDDTDDTGEGDDTDEVEATKSADVADDTKEAYDTAEDGDSDTAPKVAYGIVSIFENTDKAVNDFAVDGLITGYKDDAMEVLRYEKCSDVPDGASVLGYNLETIIEKFKKCVAAREEFLQHFTKWHKRRNENIELLKTIADDLDEYRKNCNISRIIGSSVGIVGGAAAIVGAALIPFTAGISSSLMIAGGVVGGAGGVGNVATAITETVLIQKKIEKAKHLLKMDHEGFEPLKKWLNHSTGFIEAVEKIMSFSVFLKILDGFHEILDCFLNCSALSLKILSFMKKYMISVSESAIVDLVQLLTMIVEDPALRELLTTMSNLQKSNIIVYEAIVLTARVLLPVGRLADVGVDAAVAACAVLKSGATVSRSVSTVLTHGVLTGIGVALDVVNVVLTSIDLSNGSKCDSAVKIRSAIGELITEMYSLVYIHTEVLDDSKKNANTLLDLVTP